jgi:hypothetical protein
MSHLFDGQFKSRPNVNLAGSSRNRDKEHLIREAFLERKKREEEKKQHQSALKIQSCFRSYLVRQKIKNEFRLKFKEIFNNNENNEDHTEQLLSYFVVFFDNRLDQDDLNKFSQFILKNKEKLLQSNKKVHHTLVKFLAIHLKILNHSQPIISHSVSLRLIDFFTDSKYCKSTLKSLIIKYDYLSQLVKYSIKNIPDTVQNENQAPLIYSLGYLIYRVFLCYETNTNETLNGLIVEKIFVDLFSKSNSNQIKCIIQKIAQLINSNQDTNYIFNFLLTLCKR